ncbi:MAG: hypothetical protein U9Q07_03735 [Planctomycetota bacterium]|nr:hypothetical protein [Planctomycetota bacterium]
MNLNDLKTGDRVWVISSGDGNPKTANYSDDDSLLRAKPFEAIFLSNKESLGAYAECAYMSNGRVFIAGKNHIFPTREKAVVSKIDAIAERGKQLQEGHQRYIEILNDPPT